MWEAGTLRFATRRVRARFVCVASMIGVALAAVAGATLAANVVTTDSGWSWSSPQPQGADLNAVAFAGGRGYAVGPHGTALVSGDGGLTWTGLHTGTAASLGVVRVIGADTVIVAGGCDARRSDDGGTSFTRLPFDSGDAGCPSPVAALSFPNSSIGYVVLQDGTVLRTADGGQTFSRSGAVPGPAAAFFTSPDTGFVGGGQGLYETANDGVTFKRVLAVPVTDVDFPSPQVGYAVGAGAFYTTIDGGQTWTSRSLATLGASTAFTGVRCATTTLCLATSNNGAGQSAIVRTTDGGLAFTAQAIGGGEQVNATDFAYAGLRAVAVGARGRTLVSDDDGLTFSPVGERLAGPLLGLSSGPTGTYVAGDAGSLQRSTDGGASWNAINVPTASTVAAVSFPSAAVGYALDGAGGLFKTPNAGAGWIALAPGGGAPATLYAPAATRLLLVGPVGMRLSTDGGSTFAPVGLPSGAGSLDRVAAAGGGAIVAWGTHTLLRSLTGGSGWTALRLPQRRTSILDVDLLSGGAAGYLLDAQHRLWVTRNAGRSWAELPGLGTNAGQSLAFNTLGDGFVRLSGLPGAGGGGWVLHTADGGRTWQPELVAPEALAQVVPGGAGAGGYALAGDDELFATPAGGSVGTPTSILLRPARATRGLRTVTVSGRLVGSVGGEQVELAWRPAGSLAWRARGVAVGAGGAFTANVTAGAGGRVVASWPGDGVRAGAGSPALTVAPPRRGH